MATHTVKTTISLPKTLKARMERHKNRLVVSDICAKALEAAVDELDRSIGAVDAYLEQNPNTDLADGIRRLMEHNIVRGRRREP